MNKSVFLLIALLAAAPLMAQVLDRIVAVVDNDLILDSELSAQVELYIRSNKVDPKTPGLREQVLQSMINEKLIVAKAIEDSVTVTDEEVQQQLDAVIAQRVQQVGSEARLEELYGMPLNRIKREFRDEMRKNLLAQKLQQQRFGNEEIGRYAVEDFYRTYRDSLPRVPEEVTLSQIVVKPRYTDEAKAAARARAQLLLDSIRLGVDFGALAKRHSEDPGSAVQGGDLGFVRRGQFVKEFETAAFALADSQVSGMVETEFGYHIIQLLARRGDAIHARHILVRIERTKASDDATIALLDTLRTRALAGESFANLAKQFSENKENNLLGGDLGTWDVNQLDKSIALAVADLKPGEISIPTRIGMGTSYAYEIVLLRSRTPAHNMTLETDYHRIETIALNYRRTKEYQEWINELRSQLYWESRL